MGLECCTCFVCIRTEAAGTNTTKYSPRQAELATLWGSQRQLSDLGLVRGKSAVSNNIISRFVADLGEIWSWHNVSDCVLEDSTTNTIMLDTIMMAKKY